MKLPNGITGFYELNSDAPPRVDWKPFKQLCFDVALRNGGKVKEFYMAQYPTTFHYAKVEISEDEFFILLNKHYPYLAFASLVGFEGITFMDRQDLIEQLHFSYFILEERELNEPFNQDVINHSKLNAAELEQITYWKPETIGEVIFNYWD